MTREEFELFYHRVFYKVFHYTMAIVDDRPAAEDIVTDALVKLWTMDTTYIKDLEAFLMTSCKNAARNLKTRAKNHRRIEVELAMCKDTFTPPTVTNEEYQAFLVAIYLLDHQCQRIFRMAYLESLTNEEITEELGISLKTVSNQKGIGVMKLRKILNLK